MKSISITVAALLALLSGTSYARFYNYVQFDSGIDTSLPDCTQRRDFPLSANGIVGMFERSGELLSAIDNRSVGTIYTFTNTITVGMYQDFCRKWEAVAKSGKYVRGTIDNALVARFPTSLRELFPDKFYTQSNYGYAFHYGGTASGYDIRENFTYYIVPDAFPRQSFVYQFWTSIYHNLKYFEFPVLDFDLDSAVVRGSKVEGDDIALSHIDYLWDTYNAVWGKAVVMTMNTTEQGSYRLNNLAVVKRETTEYNLDTRNSFAYNSKYAEQNIWGFRIRRYDINWETGKITQSDDYRVVFNFGRSLIGLYTTTLGYYIDQILTLARTTQSDIALSAIPSKNEIANKSWIPSFSGGVVKAVFIDAIVAYPILEISRRTDPVIL